MANWVPVHAPRRLRPRSGGLCTCNSRCFLGWFPGDLHMGCRPLPLQRPGNMTKAEREPKVAFGHPGLGPTGVRGPNLKSAAQRLPLALHTTSRPPRGDFPRFQGSRGGGDRLLRQAS